MSATAPPAENDPPRTAIRRGRCSWWCFGGCRGGGVLWLWVVVGWGLCHVRRRRGGWEWGKDEVTCDFWLAGRQFGLM